MNKNETSIETEKIAKNLTKNTILFLNSIVNESKIIDFKEREEYDQFQMLLKEGYLTKDYRTYSLTEKGKEFLKENKLVKECVSVKFKKLNEQENVIYDDTVNFEVEADGLPIIRVNEEVYANLIHRERGQHWKQYLGEEGRQLIRQKKLDRFYVEDEKTGRRYLYIMPKN